MFERLLENKEHCLTAAAEQEPTPQPTTEKTSPAPKTAEKAETSLTTRPPQSAHQPSAQPGPPSEAKSNSVKPAATKPDKPPVSENTPRSAVGSSPQQPTPPDDKSARFEPEDAPEKLTVAEEKKRAVHARRQRRYQMVRSLHQQGLSIREIARRTNISRQTVSKYINAEQCPQYPKGVKRTSKLDPYVGVIRQRLAAGCHNARTIFHDLRKRGSDGSYELVARCCRKVAGRKAERCASSQSSPPKEELLPWSARRASWVLTKPHEDLTLDEESALKRITVSDQEVAEAHTLGQRFGSMIRQQDASALMPWLEAIVASGIDTLKRFASGIEQDFDAVNAALRLPYSQGQVEGQVNRLKLIKRQMYGRAKFDLLRKRVLGYQAPG
jgi:hypothetical protein